MNRVSEGRALLLVERDPPGVRRDRRHRNAQHVLWEAYGYEVFPFHAEILRRAFAIDVLTCPSCGGRMRMVALVKDPAEVRRFLGGLGLPTEPPAQARARAPPAQPRAGPASGRARTPAPVELDLDLAVDPPAPDDPA